jgi:hippurate hydrolase
VGGHGSAPDKAKDPVVLAAQIVMALQTIASREVTPGETAVVTVGSIHGGTKRNIIPDEVRLLLTVRTFSEGTRQKVLASIGRIARGLGQAAGMPEDRLPEIVTRADESVPATYNDPVLAARIGAEFRRWFGEEGAVEVKAVTGSEDFGLFGRVEPKIPTFFFFVGGLAPALDESSRATGKPPPSIHSPFWAPVPEATLKTGVTAMTAAALELMPRR